MTTETLNYCGHRGPTAQGNGISPERPEETFVPRRPDGQPIRSSHTAYADHGAYRAHQAAYWMNHNGLIGAELFGARQHHAYESAAYYERAGSFPTLYSYRPELHSYWAWSLSLPNAVKVG